MRGSPPLQGMPHHWALGRAPGSRPMSLAQGRARRVLGAEGRAAGPLPGVRAKAQRGQGLSPPFSLVITGHYPSLRPAETPRPRALPYPGTQASLGACAVWEMCLGRLPPLIRCPFSRCQFGVVALAGTPESRRFLVIPEWRVSFLACHKPQVQKSPEVGKGDRKSVLHRRGQLVFEATAEERGWGVSLPRGGWVPYIPRRGE